MIFHNFSERGVVFWSYLLKARVFLAFSLFFSKNLVFFIREKAKKEARRKEKQTDSLPCPQKQIGGRSKRKKEAGAGAKEEDRAALFGIEKRGKKALEHPAAVKGADRHEIEEPQQKRRAGKGGKEGTFVPKERA